jgi:protein gp37
VTSIEWTDCTWNPVRGCSRVSEGCRNCYAERRAARFSAAPLFGISGRKAPFEGFAEMTPSGPRWTGRVELIASKLDEPLRWRKPRRVFVNSMSDLFHEALDDDDIDRVFAVMKAASRHTFQVLTKRADRMCRYGHLTEVVPNVWLGVSVEDQKTADERIPLLLETPAAVRFVSYEPALGPVDFRCLAPVDDYHTDALDTPDPSCRLHWVIVGGESGPGARPMHPDWPASLRRQCADAGTAFFFKQRGEWSPVSWGCQASDRRPWGVLAADGTWFPETTPWNGRTLAESPDREELMVRVGGHGGNPSEWPEDLRVREMPA